MQVTKNHLKILRRSIALALMTGLAPVMATTTNAQTVDGIAVSGYIDPTYIYNQDAHISSFFFANPGAAYTYYHSTFGDLYLDFNKKLSNGGSVDIQLMPTRGYGSSFGTNGGSIINAAVLTLPVTTTIDFIAGQMPAWDGYESETSPQMLTVTHNLLYDFSEPGYFTGAGGSYTAGILTVQTMLGNSWNTSYTGSAASTKAPTFEYRISLAPTSALSLGLYGTYGKNSSATTTETTRIYNDFDGAYTLGAATFNWQFDLGRQQDAAANGGNALWYGTSLLANYRFTPMVGATLRYDYLNDEKNGGHVSTADKSDGFYVPTTAVGVNNGPIRQAITADLLLYPEKNTIVKFEYRYDKANADMFQDSATSAYKTSNNVLAAQIDYSF
ncbi:MAG TPA: DUF3138 family protein [Acidiferrobacter sp.]|nr:DUF3138 family protein [Acidiferrobacter sp.]